MGESRRTHLPVEQRRRELTETAVRVMAWVEPLSYVMMRCALSMENSVPKSEP